MMFSKKGMYFSLDAMIAIGVVLLLIIIAFPITRESNIDSKIGEDIISTLSNLKMSDFENDPQIYQYATDPNKSVLEQIGEYYATGNFTEAKDLSELMFQDIETNDNFGIWFSDKLVVSVNDTPIEDATVIDTSTTFISGIINGTSSTGFSARAFLSQTSPIIYTYFGGFVGEGNITANISLSESVYSVELEMAINNDFDLYINNNHAAHFTGSGSDEFTPVSYTLDSGNNSLFIVGDNIVEFIGNDLHIAGGYLKITLDTQSFQNKVKDYKFPGIEGYINLYDGIVVPNTLTSMSIYLHLNSTDITTFLNIGNQTVYRNVTNDEEFIYIDNDNLSSILDYNQLSNTTIPIRLGLENATFTLNGSGNADTISVTDLSGSMSECGEYLPAVYNCSYSCGLFTQTEYNCQVNDVDDCRWPERPCGGFLCGGQEILCNRTKLELAKESNEIYVSTVLNSTSTRVGLVGFGTTAHDDDAHKLSADNTSLLSKIDDWSSDGPSGQSTCICCGINRARSELESNSTHDRFKTIVVMSDGEATTSCAQQGTTDDLNFNNISDDHGDDAIKAACDAFMFSNITVHAVAFGNDSDITTMQQIAACGNGSYFFSAVDELVEIYQQIAEDVLAATFFEQTIEISGGSGATTLYPDSFINLNYTLPQTPSGLRITTEQLFINETTGMFSIPPNSTFVEATVASYSGPRWTDFVFNNGMPVYSLANYGSTYLDLGDPYSLLIDPSTVSSNNTVDITTGLDPDESFRGSASNKIIYTTVRNISSFSSIEGFSGGCDWTVQFEDDTTLSFTAPTNYSGNDECFYNDTTLDAESVGLYGDIANNNDVAQLAVLDLLRQLDSNINGKLDALITEQGLSIDVTTIIGIPYTYEVKVQVRTWR